MPPRALSTASISFGLVTVPVRVYAATETSAGLSFHLLHRKDGVRLRQQLVRPADGEVVPRKDAVKGYELERDRFVAFTQEELKALDEQATRGIEIEEFVPLPTVDPAYFERTYYRSPDNGGDRAFATHAFDPSRYQDEVRARVRELIDRKAAGETITQPEAAPPRGQVVDLMAALKASLDRRRAGDEAAPSARESARRAPAKAKAAARRAAAPGRRATSRAARKAS